MIQPIQSRPLNRSFHVASPYKRGISLRYSDAAWAQEFTKTGHVSWVYDWTTSLPSPASQSHAEFVPMLWTSPDVQPFRLAGWQAAAPHARDLLGFNEPDVTSPDPGNSVYLDPVTAAQAWMKYMQPYGTMAGGYARLISPAISNGPNGLPWLQRFLAECNALGCQIDAIAYHWYDSATNLPYFQRYLKQVQAVAGGRPLWLTEFTGKGASPEEEVKFIESVLPWLDGLDQTVLERYAYYGAVQGRLIDEAGTGVSTQGRAYIDSSSVRMQLAK